jgi:LmbE family N-acetylglucosaminyl deacetylase
MAEKTLVAITAGGGDYIMGAGGTIATLVADGYRAFVIQAGNDEKNSIGLGPAESRLANNADAEKAARLLGVAELFNLNNKSGELSQLTSNELRTQMTTLIRYYKPAKLFLPDPFVHYEPEWDQFWTGRAAEETNYSNAGYFLPELAKAGVTGHSVAETYYYTARRPYRPGEGGHGSARFMPVDVSAVFARKVEAYLALRTANRAYATHVKQRLEAAGRPSRRLANLDDAAVDDLARARLAELAETIGQKHRFRFGEEFNYHGTAPGEKRSRPPWVRERERPRR